MAAFYEQLLTRIAPQPGIEAVAVTSALPLAGGNHYLAFTVEGKIPAPNERQPDAESRAVSPDYFRALHIPLRRGRLIDARDGKDAPAVAVISETLARVYFGKHDPLGKRITFGDPLGKEPQWQTVIGIVGDVHGSTLAEKPYAQIDRPFAQSPRRGATLIVRTRVIRWRSPPPRARRSAHLRSTPATFEYSDARTSIGRLGRVRDSR